MRKTLFILIALCCVSPVSAATRYVSQAGGIGGGTNCNGHGTITVASLSITVQSPGDVNWLCGPITSGFTVGGSGSNGNPVQFLWDVGSRVSVTFGQIINLNSQSYLLFDGGTPCGPNTNCYAIEAASPTGYPASITGIIEATANGSALANQNTTTQAFYGCNPCGGTIEIRNLILRNLYQHTSTTDNTNNADSGNFVFQCSSGATACPITLNMHDDDIHDAGNAISLEHFNAASITLSNLECWHINWCVEDSGNGTRTIVASNIHCHDASNWDTGADTFHHNCWHAFQNASSDSLGLYIYNSRSDGNWGTCCTTANFLFIEVAPPANLFVYNNVVIQQCSNSNPAVTMRTQNAGAGGAFYNNTFLGCSSTPANVSATELYGTNVTFENNIDETYGQYVVTGSTATFAALDYNSYGAIGTSGNSPWQFGATGDATFANWKASCTCDSHGQKLASLNVNSSTGAPNVGSSVIGAGLNLCNGVVSCTGNLSALAADINGIARPAVAAWTAGATNGPSAGFATPVSAINP